MGPPASLPADPLLDPWRHHSVFYHRPFPSNRTAQLGRNSQERYSLSDASGGLDPVPRDILERRTSQVDSDPLVRFWRDDGPWHAQGIGIGNTGGFVNQASALPGYAASRERSDRPYAFSGKYRAITKTGPEIDQSARLISDEGYGTQSRVTASVLSTDYPDHSQESQSFAGDADGGQMLSDSVPRGYFLGASQETRSVSCDGCSNDSRELITAHSLICEHADCGIKSKNPSDYR